MTIGIGDIAPDFDLLATTGDRMRLSDHRGRKVVLIFFPFAFSGTCTQELCAVRDRAPDYADLDAQVLGISCDSKHAQKAFAQHESLAYPLLSDFWPHGETARSYGVFVEEFGAANRATFVLDREGRVAWSVATSIGEARDETDYHRVLADIA